MSNLSDTIKAVLDKEKGVCNLKNDGVTNPDINLKKIKLLPKLVKKPPTKVLVEVYDV